MRSPSVAERWAAGLAALALLLALHGLGQPDVTGDDEAREVGIVQDILRGHVLTPRFNDDLIPDKPILFHWLAAASAAIGGFSETSARLPSALAAAVVVGGTVLAGTRLLGPWAGITAAAVLLTTPTFLARARVARPDMLLVAFLMLALASAWRWWNLRDRRAATWALIALGLATAVKGPVGPALFAATVLGFLVWQRDLRRLPELVTPLGMAGFVVLGCGWYALALGTWGNEFVSQHLVGRYVRNLAGGLGQGHAYSPKSSLYHLLFYPLHLPLVALPWTPVLAIALWRAWHERGFEDPRLRFLVCAALAPVVVFTPAEWKLRYYLLPSLPPMALMTAPLILALARARSSTPTRPSLIAAGIVVSGAIAGAMTVLGHPELLAAADQPRFDAIVSIMPGGRSGIGIAVGITAGLASALIAFRIWGVLLGGVAVAMVVWSALGLPALERAESRRASLRPFAESIATWAVSDTALAFWARPVRQVVVYAQRTIPSVAHHREALESGMGLILTERAHHRLEAEGVVGPAIVTGAGRLANLAHGTLVLARVR